MGWWVGVGRGYSKSYNSLIESFNRVGVLEYSMERESVSVEFSESDVKKMLQLGEVTIHHKGEAVKVSMGTEARFYIQKLCNQE